MTGLLVLSLIFAGSVVVRDVAEHSRELVQWMRTGRAAATPQSAVRPPFFMDTIFSGEDNEWPSR